MEAVRNWGPSRGRNPLEVATRKLAETGQISELEIAVEGICSVFLSVGGTADEMTIELMEPLDKADLSNAVARRLAKSGEGFYHLAVEVGDIQGSSQSLAGQGLTVLQRPATSDQHAPRWLVHPKDANGVMVEGIVRR